MLICIYSSPDGSLKKVFETHETNETYIIYSIKSFANLTTVKKFKLLPFLPFHKQIYKNQGIYQITNTNTGDVRTIYVKGNELIF